MATKKTTTKKTTAKKVAKKTAVTSKKFPTAAEAKKQAIASKKARPANAVRKAGSVNKVIKPAFDGKPSAISRVAGTVAKSPLGKVAGRVAGPLALASVAKEAWDLRPGGKTDKEIKAKIAAKQEARKAADKGKVKSNPDKVFGTNGQSNYGKTANQKTAILDSKRYQAQSDAIRNKASRAADVARYTAQIPKTATKTTAATKAIGTGKSVTVKSGDTLSAIAKANGTTVAALYKANPTLAKRKAEGKVQIFSGTKVRIPKK